MTKYFHTSTLRRFILAQRNKRKVDLWEGNPDDVIGCVLSHFAQSRKLDYDFAGFRSIRNGQTIVAEFQQSLTELINKDIYEAAAKVKNYGQLKKLLN